jgi:predicted MPP superfamily phosphohydrolase
MVCGYFAGNIYIFIRGIQALALLPLGLKISLAILFWICVFLIFAGFAAQNSKLPYAFEHVIHEVGTSWLIVTLYMTLSLLCCDILRLFIPGFRFGFFISLFLTIIILSIGYIHYRNPNTRVFNIHINKFNAGLQKPLKIVAVSDIHLGYGTGKASLKKYVQMINAQHPDLILIGGDLVDRTVVPLYSENMLEELNQLNAPLGIYMVPGNHEYYAGIQKCIEYVKHTGIQLLMDSVVTLPNGIQLIGRDDKSNPRRKSLKQLRALTDPSKPTILIDHQPYRLEETEKEGIDLQFSGHTHEGQVWPLSLATDKIFDQSYGYRKWGDSQVYVSSGFSLWGPPFRIGTDSEMIVFMIK